MKGNPLVASQDQVIGNILCYQAALEDGQRGSALRKLMPFAHVWYATRADGGRWLFAPSKFVGYAENTAESYLREQDARDGRQDRTHAPAMVPRR